ncbi:MAG: beta-ketoacyl-[acyl-carrier-protein] synthase family protein [Actinomycetota bacterium]
MTRRVAIVGAGIKAPGGCDVATFWQTQFSGRTQAAPTEFENLEALSAAPIACTIPVPVEEGDYFARSEARRMDPATRFGAAAAIDAIASADARAVLESVEPQRRACVVGTGVGGLRTYEEQATIDRTSGVMRVSPFTVPMVMPNALTGWLTVNLDLQGSSSTIALACASSTASIGEAMHLIRAGRADVVLAGGMEHTVWRRLIGSFGRMEALSTWPGDPSGASRPFSADRCGFVMGEGGAMFVLAAEETARAAGATILGWIDGFGGSSDAHHMVAPLENGAGAAASMRNALDDAGLTSDQIGHVNAHGTSTPRNDDAESQAIMSVFGDHRPPVTATKGITGHLIGGSGAVEALATLLAASTGQCPPVANTVEKDPAIEADIVIGEARTLPQGSPSISNSFAFGGHNATLVISPGDVAPLLS